MRGVWNDATIQLGRVPGGDVANSDAEEAQGVREPI